VLPGWVVLGWPELVDAGGLGNASPSGCDDMDAQD
jgi:hypothetical protein